MKKAVRKPASKAVVGNAKYSKGLKLTMRSALFGLVGIMAFSVIAGLGYQKWQDHQLKAKAVGYGRYSYQYNKLKATLAYVKACSLPVESKYGPLWEVRFYQVRTVAPVVSATGAKSSYQGVSNRVTVYRKSANKNIHNVVITQTKAGESSYKKVWVSRILDDKLTGISDSEHDIDASKLMRC